jgi:maleate isomerase
VKAAVRYYTDPGFAPAAFHRLDPGGKWRDLPPQDLVGQGLGFEQETEPLVPRYAPSAPPRQTAF